MTTAAVIQARMTSTRLPGKVLLPLAGEPVIFRIIERLRQIPSVDRICISTPDGDAQEPLVAFAHALGDVTVTRGPEEDILKRLALAAQATGADTIYRFWGDCPAIDPKVCAELIRVYDEKDLVFASIPDKSGYPAGLEFEIVDAPTLLDVDRETTDPSARHIFHDIFTENPDRFPQAHLRYEPYLSDLFLLLDTVDDYARLEEIFSKLYPKNPVFGLDEIVALAAIKPALFAAEI
ncbi:MAG: NTP transferase domain-containing protein [Rhodospirillales bacterium]|nr:NTP transferase domain-containing protein [Rhodospirillales bacterium]